MEIAFDCVWCAQDYKGTLQWFCFSSDSQWPDCGRETCSTHGREPFPPCVVHTHRRSSLYRDLLPFYRVRNYLRLNGQVR